MSEVPNFWRDLSEKHGLQGQYEAFMAVKLRANKRHCFSCHDNTCCQYAGASLYLDVFSLNDSYKFIEMGEAEMRVCALLTDDFMCAVEEAKQRACIKHYCRRIHKSLTENEKRIWSNFFYALDTNCGGVDGIIKEWLGEHPEYVATARDRLGLHGA